MVLPLLAELFGSLASASLRVDIVAFSFRNHSSGSSLDRPSLVVDTDGHRAVQPIVLEVVLGAAAFGSLDRVHQAVQLDIPHRLVLSLRHFVGFFLLEAMLVEFSEGAV
jgi:hypothetical protein